jgi:endogenous inhibitor of DNA gyrase (YacG/DUF329 family)
VIEADMAEGKSTEPRRRCPICKAEAVAEFMPFCSKRCSDIDLGKWFTASYVVPSAIDSDDEVYAPDADKPDEA